MTFRSLYNCTLKTGTRLQNYFFFLLKFINRGGRHWRQEVRHFLVSLASRTFGSSCTTWRWWKPCLIRFLSRNIFVLFFHNSKSAKSLCLEFPLSVRLKLAVNSPSHQIKHWRRMQTARRVLHFLTNMSFKNVHSCGCVFKHCVNFMANGRLSPWLPWVAWSHRVAWGFLQSTKWHLIKLCFRWFEWMSRT